MEEHPANKKRKLPIENAKGGKLRATSQKPRSKPTTTMVLSRKPTHLKKVKLRQPSAIRQLKSPPSVKKLHQIGEPTIGGPQIDGQAIFSGQLDGQPSDDAANPTQSSEANVQLAIRATATTNSPLALTTTSPETPPKEGQDQIRQSPVPQLA